MGRIKRAASVAASVALAGLLAGCEGAQPWTHELVTVNASGDSGGNADTFGGSFSPDGTKVLFSTFADNLGPADTNFATDIYLRDLDAGTTTLVSHNPDGTAAGATSSGSFSPDGSQIVFSSAAADLVGGDTNGAEDVFVYDVASGEISLVSLNAAGTASAAGQSFAPLFNPDGTKVAFVSGAGDFGPTDSARPPAPPPPPGFPVIDTNLDIYVRDLALGATSLVTVNGDGTDSANRESSSIEGWSPDGTRLAFVTGASNFGPTDTNNSWDPYFRDLATGATQLVSMNAAGTGAGNLSSSSPVWSPDGTRVLFSSDASDLGPTDTTTTASDLYLRDLTTGTTTMVSVDAAGTDGANQSVFRGSFSPDGTKVLFNTAANNLGPTDTNPWPDIYLRDLTAGTTTLLSTNAAGTDASEGLILSDAHFSPDGTKVAFTTLADDLGPPDNGGVGFPRPDVYVRNLATGTVTMVSARADGTTSGNDNSFFTAWSPDSTRVLFSSRATDLGPPDGNTFVDVYLATLQGTDMTVTLAASPDAVSTGDQLTYTLVVTNAGPRSAPGSLAALLVLPEGVSFDAVDAGPAATCTPPVPAPPPDEPLLVTCEFGTTSPGFTAEITVTTTVTAPAGTVLDALAGFGTSGIDPDPANGLARTSTPVV